MTDTRFNVRIGAKDETGGAVASAGKGFSSLGSSVIVANQAFGLLSQTVGPALRGIVELTTGYVDNGRELLNLTRRLGGSVEMWDELRFVGEKYNVTQSAMEMGLQRMTRRLGEAAKFGKGEAVPALKALNLTVEDFQGLDPGESYLKLAEALAEVPDAATRAALAMKFFDSEGVALVQTMGDGAAGVRAAVEEYRKFGGMTKEQAERAEKLGQKLDLLQVAADRAKVSFIDGFLGGLGDADVTRLGQLVVKLGEAAGYLAKISQFGIAARVLSSIGGGAPETPSAPYATPLDRLRANAEQPAYQPGNLEIPREMRYRRPADIERAERLQEFQDQQAKKAEEAAARMAALWDDLAKSMDKAGDPVVTLIKAAEDGPDAAPIMEKIEGIDLAFVDAAQSGYDAAEALTRNINLTAQLGEEFGANVVDAAFRAADAWAYFAADAIVYGGNVFDALKAGLQSLLSDIIGSAAQQATRNFVTGVLSLIPGVGPVIAAASAAQGSPGFTLDGSPPVAFAGAAPSNVNINVATTFGTRSEAIQVAERVANAMVEGGFMRRAF